ncbi:MAG: hypothetical protein KME45_05105 [Stenomitos rutilans HA7619-LM2]|jgi:hypothetical protein|nr:hypothetical protein [Stenomitos rutilans HA7619-LM2]
MNAESVKRVPWVSCALLLIAYGCFGWLVASPTLTNPTWLSPTCQGTFSALHHLLPLAIEPLAICRVIIRENLVGATLAIAWVVVASCLFISPLTSFNRFITRWFQSDTVAFLAVCVIAGLIVCILFWLQLFLHISTILASEALARIDLQTLGLSKLQAFWILVLLSLVGLGIGWGMRLSI